MAKRIILLAVIIGFWFLLSFTLGLMALDPLISSNTVNSSDYSINIDTSTFNASDTESLDSTTNIATGFGGAVKFLFGAKVTGLSDMPTPVKTFIRFLNYLIVIVTVALVYKIVNPLAA